MNKIGTMNMTVRIQFYVGMSQLLSLQIVFESIQCIEIESPNAVSYSKLEDKNIPNLNQSVWFCCLVYPKYLVNQSKLSLDVEPIQKLQWSNSHPDLVLRINRSLSRCLCYAFSYALSIMAAASKRLFCIFIVLGVFTFSEFSHRCTLVQNAK